jgi:hypothetical protein
MNCYLYENKVLVLRHGLMENGEYVANDRIGFRFVNGLLQPPKGVKPQECPEFRDFVYYQMNIPWGLKKVGMRKGEPGEEVYIISHTDESEQPGDVVFSCGLYGGSGYHTCSTDLGYCMGPIISSNDHKIIGFHCVGGKTANKCWFVDDAMIKHLNTKTPQEQK